MRNIVGEARRDGNLGRVLKLLQDIRTIAEFVQNGDIFDKVAVQPIL
jgi:hypothetical protein